MGEGMILRLYTKAGHNNLFLNNLTNQVMAKKNTITNDEMLCGNINNLINI